MITCCLGDGEMKLSIITVTFNDETVLPEFIRSLEESEVGTGRLTAEVCVVDNHSTDQTPALLKEVHHSWFTLVLLKKNKGFAAANNEALAQAKGEYILFLNPDTSFQHGVCEGMCTYLDEHENVGAVTPHVVLPDGTLDRNTLRNFPTPLSALFQFSGLASISRRFSGYYREPDGTQNAQEVPACGGACLMVRRSVVEKIGKWDEGFFLYGEDLDYCFRIHEAGWGVHYLPWLQLIHYGGVSTGIKKSGSGHSRASVATRIAMATYSVEAMQRFYSKHEAQHHTAAVNGLVLLGMKSLLLMRKIGFLLWRH